MQFSCIVFFCLKIVAHLSVVPLCCSTPIYSHLCTCWWNGINSPTHTHTVSQLETSHMILARCWPNQFHGSPTHGSSYWPTSLLSFMPFAICSFSFVNNVGCGTSSGCGGEWLLSYLSSGQAVDQVGTIKMIFLFSAWHCTLSMSGDPDSLQLVSAFQMSTAKDAVFPFVLPHRTKNRVDSMIFKELF